MGRPVGRYRYALDNLLVTDFLRLTLFRPEVGRLDVVLAESVTREGGPWPTFRVRITDVCTGTSPDSGLDDVGVQVSHTP